jgi:putative nucleotidyltransferase with HDIG domain
VSRLSVSIAHSLGLADRQIERIGVAALLHDVGKIHEKYAPILAKSERLSPDEWLVIQEHPADGAELVATISRLRDIVPAVRHHHEHWDGSGYPDRLRGEAIPLASRIIMMADTIDAMTSERPYRRPLGRDVVRAEILRHRGRQFDPQIADRVLSREVWEGLFEVPLAPVSWGGLALVQGDARNYPGKVAS